MANAGEEIRKISVNGVELAYRFDGAAGGRVVMMSNSLMCDQAFNSTLRSFIDRVDDTLPHQFTRIIGGNKL
jgi:hypothetical protein